MKRIYCGRGTILCVVFILLLSVTAEGQVGETSHRIPEKYWSIELGAGTVFMPGKAHDPLLAERPSVGFHSGVTVGYAFHPRWAAYVELASNLYDNERPAFYDQDVVGLHGEDIIGAIFGAFELIKPTVSTGIMYRLQTNKWEFSPRLGLSYTLNDWDRDRELKLKEENIRVDYQSWGSAVGIKYGLDARYWVSKKGYLLLQLLSESPLQKVEATATYFKGEEIMKTDRARSSALGQNLYFQVGYGFTFARRYP